MPTAIHSEPSLAFAGETEILNSLHSLGTQQLEALWAAYNAHRDDLNLRNRLVEHYLPWVRDMALAFARRMALRDKENAVGEVLAALVSSIVPGYDGKSGFIRWARVCTKRKLISLQRVEKKAGTNFSDLSPAPSGTSVLDLAPCQEQHSYDVNFLELTAKLSDRQAMVLWLRLYRGLTIEATAALLKVSPGSVKSWTHTAVLELQKQWANCPLDEFSAY